MKITLVSLTVLAAFLVTPLAGQASDKEVQKAHYRNTRQVALIVSGRGLGNNQAAPRMQSVTNAQVGQGGGVTFFTGNR